MPRMFQVRQQTPGQNPMLRVKGVNAQPGQRNLPVHVRASVKLGGYGDYPQNMPGPNGGPGNPVWPYSESTQWGDGSQGGAAVPQIPPAVGAPPVTMTDQQLSMPSTPYGQSSRPWHNPTTYAGFPITVGIGVTQSVLNANAQRNSLIIQNTSFATAAGDVGPTLYVGFNTSPGLNTGALALPPGLGFYWGAADCPPRDNIIVQFLGGANGGGTVVVAGSVIQGTYLPDDTAPPLRPGQYGAASGPSWG